MDFSRRRLFGVAAGAATIAVLPVPQVTIEAVAKARAVDPLIWVADDEVLSAVRTFPGGLTFYS